MTVLSINIEMEYNHTLISCYKYMLSQHYFLNRQTYTLSRTWESSFDWKSHNHAEREMK